MNEPRKTFPIQCEPKYREATEIAASIYLRAYEVYSHVYGPQEAMVTGGCRGGMGVGEIIAFLWAYPFPKAEWDARVHQAFASMKSATK